MQSVTYRSGEREITFSLSPPYLLEKAEGLHGLESLLLTSESPWHDGTQFHSLRLPDREITLSFQIEGKDRADMYQKRLQAMSALRPADEDGRLVYRNDAGSWWIPAIVKQPPVADSRQQNFNHCTVVFLCPDPFWRSMEPVVADLAYEGQGLVFPLELGKLEFGKSVLKQIVINDGDSPAPLYMRIHGPADCPKIIKESTGEFIRVKTKLDEGYTLEINTARGKASVEIVRSRIRRNGFGYLDLGSAFFQLDPGPNTLRYASADDTLRTLANVEFYSTYGGV